MQHPNNSFRHGGNELESDLPTSLPSYLPTNAPQPGNNNSNNNSSNNSNRKAGGGLDMQHKPPPPPPQLNPAFFYNPNTAPMLAKMKAERPPPIKPMGNASGQTTPVGTVALGFPNDPNIAHSMLMPSNLGASGSLAGKSEPTTPQLSSGAASPFSATGSEIAGISAAQFAAGTGGLIMDATLLARVSGTDPSRMGSEEIKQIMRCPDLLSIYQKLQEEDERRRRRLERNRASARVRREKKKSMVETFEGEVSKLEYSLNLLKSHRFGVGQAKDLVNALEYRPGEHQRHAHMSNDAKIEIMGQILEQNTRITRALQRANLENQLIMGNSFSSLAHGEELWHHLRLTPEQVSKLKALETPILQETHKLQVIAKCFATLQAHDWLVFPGSDLMLQQTRSAMTPSQFQKFLNWTSENKRVIECLQIMAGTSGSISDEDLEFTFSEE